MVYPCKPHFYYLKVGFKGVLIARTCFPDEVRHEKYVFCLHIRLPITDRIPTFLCFSSFLFLYKPYQITKTFGTFSSSITSTVFRVSQFTEVSSPTNQKPRESNNRSLKGLFLSLHLLSKLYISTHFTRIFMLSSIRNATFTTNNCYPYFYAVLNKKCNFYNQ